MKLTRWQDALASRDIAGGDGRCELVTIESESHRDSLLLALAAAGVPATVAIRRGMTMATSASVIEVQAGDLARAREAIAGVVSSGLWDAPEPSALRVLRWAVALGVAGAVAWRLGQMLNGG